MFDSINRGSMASQPLAVPPLEEQRRIIDLLGALDEAAALARRNLQVAEVARRAVVLDALDPGLGVEVPLADVLELVIGGAWGDPPGTQEAEASALNLLVFNSQDLTVDPSHSTKRSFSRPRLDARSISQNDILLERSGGTDDRPVGRVVRAREALPDVVPTDFMRLLRVRPAAAEPEYVFWWLWGRYERGDSRAHQSKTTNIRNLQVNSYLNLPIVLPNRDQQVRVASVGQCFTDLISLAAAEVERYSATRASLLYSLLTADNRIPDSYDRFLHTAA